MFRGDLRYLINEIFNPKKVNLFQDKTNIIRNISTIFLLLLSIQVFSQKFEMKIDSILNLEIADLKTSGIEEVGYTKLACINYGVHSTVYLFWTKNDSVFIQKFKHSEYNEDSLKKFKSIQIDDSTFFNYYDINKDELKKENVEHFKHKPDSIVGNITHSRRVTISHSCYRNFVIKTDNENFHKFFDHFDLEEFSEKKVFASKRNYTKEEKQKWIERGWEGMETEIIHENYPKRNINFEQNKELKLIEWSEILTEFIEKLESEHKFELLKSE